MPSRQGMGLGLTSLESCKKQVRSAPEECEELVGEDLRDEDIRDVLLAVDGRVFTIDLSPLVRLAGSD